MKYFKNKNQSGFNHTIKFMMDSKWTITDEPSLNQIHNINPHVKEFEVEPEFIHTEKCVYENVSVS